MDAFLSTKREVLPSSPSPSPAGDAAAKARLSASLSGAKRVRSSTIEFDADELMETLGVDDSYMVLGIDEAGRGPVLGPMVYTAAMVSLAEHYQLVDDCHVADSKCLDEQHRITANEQMKKLKTLQFFTTVISPDEISSAMLGRGGRNLNTLSHDAAMQLISQATLAGAGKLCAVYVDTVGPPETYQARLAGRFPHLRVTVSKKADSKFPIVSAASIVAKVTRDDAVHAMGVAGEVLGSGYPSDPATKVWLRNHLHRFFVFEDRFVRQSWGPVLQLAEEHCVPIVFEQDVLTDRSRPTRSANQKTLQFGNSSLPPPRAPIYTHMLHLSSVMEL